MTKEKLKLDFLDKQCPQNIQIIGEDQKTKVNTGGKLATLFSSMRSRMFSRGRRRASLSPTCQKSEMRYERGRMFTGSSVLDDECCYSSESDSPFSISSRNISPRSLTRANNANAIFTSGSIVNQ
ncbi:uncharacterized protein LOC142357971, partial [Convolutriloba macropyga]|uniref:uncharacterized protein LOC142357971 n=1 Tax=Convolutriloba macropyga TaxID=536237 RepID=UPI003F51F40B